MKDTQMKRERQKGRGAENAREEDDGRRRRSEGKRRNEMRGERVEEAEDKDVNHNM